MMMMMMTKRKRMIKLTLTMKTFIPILLLLTFAFSLNAQQLEIGAKLGLGASRIHSKNLPESFNYRNSLKSDIVTWDVRQRAGFAFSIGGYVQYNFSESFSALAEMSIGAARSSILIDYFEDDVDNGGDGDRETITSEAHIRFTTFAFPLLLQYNIGEKKPLFLAGIEFLFTGMPDIESFETKKTEKYDNFNLQGTDFETRSVTASFDGFRSSHSNFILGVGTSLKIADKNLYIDLQYHLPISRTTMYTTDGRYHDIAYKNNEVFSTWGKSEAESEAPQYPLNDYRISFITLSLRYTLFQK